MFYTNEQLKKIGFRKFGKNVLISDKTSIYSPQNIEIGNNVRIDDFCIISASKEIVFGDHIHIGCQSVILGKALIEFNDYSGISMQCVVISSSDDFSGKYLINPTIPEKYLNVKNAPVIFGKHVIMGANSVILPGVSLGLGCAVGAGSVVHKSIPAFEIWGGTPAKYLMMRSADLLKLEIQLKHDEHI